MSTMQTRNRVLLASSYHGVRPRGVACHVCLEDAVEYHPDGGDVPAVSGDVPGVSGDRHGGVVDDLLSGG